jgi:deoxyribodipyrimidine photo-lyase
MSTPVLVWFRRNLRINDNRPLHSAVEVGRPVVPVYILDDSSGLRLPGDGARWWLHGSLERLNETLSARGTPLVIRRGPAADIIRSLVRECGADTVYCDTVYDPPVSDRDDRLEQDLAASHVRLIRQNTSLLHEPDEIRTRNGEPYQVFAPFWRRLLTKELTAPLLPAPNRIPALPQPPKGVRLADLGLQKTSPDRIAGLEDQWAPGETGAQRAFRTFLSFNLTRYAGSSETPGATSTSRLSPHLAFGEIGPRQVWHAVQHRIETDGTLHKETALAFLRELAWREFNYGLLQRHPDMANKNINSVFDRIAWRSDDRNFRAWTEGQTGYPIVDAGMRELWRTGWMPNRVRMIAASFLTKHLLIDWRHGEAWFWKMLVDADPANNPANWQWVAGSGVDAAPYFRIFNPIRQGETFDHDGVYVRRWVPEVGGLSARHLHRPWATPLEARTSAGLDLGKTYPAPIVDHAAARHRALDAYNAIRS